MRKLLVTMTLITVSIFTINMQSPILTQPLMVTAKESNNTIKYSTKKDITIPAHKKINSLFVDWISGDINIRKSKNNDIRIVQKTDQKFTQSKLLTYTISKNKLTIKDGRIQKKSLPSNYDTYPGNTTLDVYIPQKLFDSLSIDATSSDIKAPNLHTSDLLIDTTSGNAEFSGDIKTLSIDTTSGNINGTVANSQKADFDTTSGNINITGAINIAAFDSTSGHIISNLSKNTKADFSTTSGNISTTGKMKDVTYDTTSGSINGSRVEIEYLEVDTVSGVTNLSGKFLDIESGSTSGNITVQSDTMIESITHESTSGDLTITIPENKGFTCLYDKMTGRFTSDFSVKKQDKKYIYKAGTYLYDFETLSGNFTIHKNNG